MTKLTTFLEGFDPNDQDDGSVLPSRQIGFVVISDQMAEVRMEHPDLPEHEWPDVAFEWQPDDGWCLYVHHNNGEVCTKIVLQQGQRTRVLVDPELASVEKY